MEHRKSNVPAFVAVTVWVADLPAAAFNETPSDGMVTSCSSLPVLSSTSVTGWPVGSCTCFGLKLHSDTLRCTSEGVDDTTDAGAATVVVDRGVDKLGANRNSTGMSNAA